MQIEALRPLTVRLPAGDLDLDPGRPVELPDDQARRLLEKASGKVRVVLPALAIGDAVYLDDGEGPLIVSMVDTDYHGITWVLVREPNIIRWINTKFVVKVERLKR